MTLEEAIIHVGDIANKETCSLECKEQHRQLKLWLEELQDRRKEKDILELAFEKVVSELHAMIQKIQGKPYNYFKRKAFGANIITWSKNNDRYETLNKKDLFEGDTNE